MKIGIIIAWLFTVSVCILDREYYKALRLPVSATPEQIRQSYRKLSRKYHPDRNPDTKTKFEKINVAYETLYNPETKYLYDRVGKEKMNDPNIMKEKNLEALKGPNMEIKLTMTLEDLYVGKQIDATIFKKTACPHCLGTGAQNSYDIVRCSECQGQGRKMKRVNVGGGYYNMVSETCPRCNGEGKIIGRKCSTCSGSKIVSGAENFSLLVEPGARHFQTIQFYNMGDEMIEGAPGDLIIRIYQARHSRFSRVGNDLHIQVSISLQEALFGFERTIQQLDGRVLEVKKIKITQPNQIIRIEGEGMPIKGTSEKGNMIVKVIVWIPPFSEQSLSHLKSAFEQVQQS